MTIEGYLQRSWEEADKKMINEHKGTQLHDKWAPPTAYLVMAVVDGNEP